MSAYLLILGDREALGWVLTSQRMAFSSLSRPGVASLALGDELFLYTTRGCFKNPTRDRGRIFGTASAKGPVEPLDRPVSFAGREFPVGCPLEIGALAPFGRGLELAPLVPRLDAFAGAGSAWSIWLRRPLLALSDRDAHLIAAALAPMSSGPAGDGLDGYTRWWRAQPAIQ